MDGGSSEDVVGKEGFSVGKYRSPGVKHHFSLLEKLRDLVVGGTEFKEKVEEFFGVGDDVVLKRHLEKLPVYEDKVGKQVVEVYSHVPFSNWGQSVHNTPKYTFLPTTTTGVQNIVLFAQESDLRVRCGGYRHSWANIFGETGEIFISFVGLEQVTTLPDPMSIQPGNYTGQGVPDLKTIELKEHTTEGKRLCRVGVAVTNEDFRRWAIHNGTWALPVDVILVEVTIGGVNGPICHGAGRRHKTISDYVRRIEYVDCNGKLQMVEDEKWIRTAAGAFGLLGVVTHITFELDEMTYAVMEPRKVDIGLAIPPLSKHDIPPELRADWWDDENADEMIEKANVEFERRAQDDYYSEWFWFTYQQRAWINTWNTIPLPPRSSPPPANFHPEYPTPSQTFLQWLEGWLGGVLTSHPFFNALPGFWQAQLLATMGMAALPPRFGEDETPTIVTPLCNALHFRRGVQNMRVRDMEVQIPIPGKKSRSDGGQEEEVPDWSTVRRAWWDAINLTYATARESDNPLDPETPMRLTLELRIMGGSDILLAPQRGNRHGTASIEVLSLPDAVADEEWSVFCQRLADRWGKLAPEGRVRPHWAKEWEGLRFGGMGTGDGGVGRGAREWAREVAYKDALVEWRGVVEEMGRSMGWGLGEVERRFGGGVMGEVVWGR
ncbi:hypothetical protein M501DRAFT_927792 [Patellaria atrata CBS 101060]|uniref:FAD-binding PCMH-type domain-containing protein n=1 Tax=Patellaria atrata CBS 101060 TaxID=1346257 RepID=A0A9P4SHR5_9PEZI|nr:hypothetical protein M501DRAFT_927792 [Patellaria atrata CBS 101060]